MELIDIVATTAYATAATLHLPAGALPIAYVPTTQYIQGIDGLVATTVTTYDATTVSLNHAIGKYNVVKLRYLAVGQLVRT
ncbi:MAG: hypothetical protein H8D26_03510 [Methanomicrobia archaeon]|nr:hypothetical protein [Methanomicrobia archaeon]